jgi:3-phenylpropionate/cinnamic acid dioxygenase small subunit
VHDLSSDEIAEIRDLYSRYALALDNGAADEWASLFAPDGRLNRPGQPELKGPGALVELCRARQSATPGLWHLTSNVKIAASGAGVLGGANVLVLQMGEDGSVALLTLGRYVDEFVKLDGAWRFRSRTFLPFI